jgi:hypothetical protein
MRAESIQIREQISVHEESAMSEIRKYIWLASAVLVTIALSVGAAVAGDFDGLPMYVDATVGEDPAVNDSLQIIRTPASGDTVKIDLFVPGAAGIKTFGFNVKFDDTGSVFTDNFTLVSAKDFSGTEMSGAGAAERSALLISQPSYPTSGLVASIILVAKQDILETVTVKLDSAGMTMADATGANDTVDLTKAVLSFAAGPKLAADVMYDITKPIPLPINASAAVTVTATGFGAGMTITWTVTPDAAASASVAGVASTDGLSNTITATGPGSATVTVSASDGTDTTNALTITFSQQEAAELATFGGELVDDRVVVSWSTASQTNNAGWRLLRSVDGENFEAVSEMVQGAGTSDAMLSYSIEDVNLPSNEKVWYQLEQVDLDGSISRSNPVEVLLGARMPVPTVFSTTVYPNPFNPSTTISYDLPNESFVSIVIYDAIGQEIRRLVSEQTAAGRYRVQWDALDTKGRAVGSGVYIAKVEAGSFSSSQKMLLLK